MQTEWNSTDAVALNRFLSDNPKVIPELRSRLATVDTTGVERCALSGAKRAGGEALVASLEAMTDSDINEPKSPFISAE